MKQLYKDCLMPALLIGGSLFLWLETNSIPPPSFEPLGAAFFPRFILSVIIFFSALLIVRNLWKAVRGIPMPQQAEKVEPTTATGYLRMGITLALLLAYVLLVSYTDIPFLILTLCYMLVFGWYLSSWRFRALPIIVLLAVATTGIVYALFGVFLGVFFP